MTRNDKMEELSRDYVLTIAHNKGFFDYNGRDYGTDMLIRKALRRQENKRTRYLSSGKAVDVQLKSVLEHNVTYSGDIVKFTLEVKNYNDLVDRSNENGATIPLILVVYIIPSDENDWVKCTSDGTLLKKEAYWYRLPSGTSRSGNTTSVTIDIPQGNRVTEEFFPNLWTSLF